MCDRKIEAVLDSLIDSVTPGLQYLALNSTGSVFHYNGGLADIQRRRPMNDATTLNAYSLSKTITAAAVLLLVQAKAVGLDDLLVRYLGSSPYGPAITIRQLLSHTFGIPNPIPLRWVHSISQHEDFDEAAAISAVLLAHSRPSRTPGSRFAYSNIGYWLLGQVVAKVTSSSFSSFVSGHVLRRLGIPEQDLAYSIPDVALHAQGYLEKYSFTNLFKYFLVDRTLIGTYERGWLRIEPHYVNGPAFGGLIGTARGFGRFLQDQLCQQSMLFEEETRDLFFGQQSTNTGKPIPMTLGWHMGTNGASQFYFKEGGGGGFHSLMRVYRPARIATVIMANATGFDVKRILNAADSVFL
jgi:CubicO group peptidase (beta-lactamase class C family)